jgi:hypothetical protein
MLETINTNKQPAPHMEGHNSTLVMKTKAHFDRLLLHLPMLPQALARDSTRQGIRVFMGRVLLRNFFEACH